MTLRNKWLFILQQFRSWVFQFSKLKLKHLTLALSLRHDIEKFRYAKISFSVEGWLAESPWADINIIVLELEMFSLILLISVYISVTPGPTLRLGFSFCLFTFRVYRKKSISTVCGMIYFQFHFYVRPAWLRVSFTMLPWSDKRA